MSGFQSFGFGRDDDSIGQKTKKFKAEGGKSYRASFAWWPIENGKLNLDAPTPEFVGGNRHYLEGVGYFLNKGPEFTKLAGSPPKTSIGTILIIWPTDAKGELDKNRLANGEFEVMPWIFGGDKYRQLSNIHSEFSLGQHDVKITCTDTQFQKMTFTPCKESILRKLSENPKASEHVNQIIAMVSELSGNLQNDIARDLTLDQIREKLSGGSGGGSFKKSDGGGGGGTVDSKEVDSMLDNLLS